MNEEAMRLVARIESLEEELDRTAKELCNTKEKLLTKEKDNKALEKERATSRYDSRLASPETQTQAQVASAQEA